MQNEARVVTGLIGGFILIVILVALNPITIVGAGERGVVFNNTTGVEDRVLTEGLHFRMPLIQTVRTVDVRVQKDEAVATAGTNDLQNATIKTVVNWRIDASKANKIYQEIGDLEAVLNSIVRPRVAEIVKAAGAKYSAEEMLTQRSNLKAEIDTKLREDLQKYNVLLDDVTIDDINFDAGFNAAIEKKAIAEQDAFAAKNRLEQTKYEGESRVVQAKAEAEAIKIQAEAVQSQGGAEYVQLQAIEKWDGRLPTYMMGDSTPIIDLK